MDCRDALAVAVFVAVFIASIVVEYACGHMSENCSIDWSGLYGDAVFYEINRCSDNIPETGLGVAMLSVSSLFFAVPAVYVGWYTKYTTLAALVLGIGSFLYHASNTEVSATLDYVGIVALGPAIAADLASRSGRFAVVAALGFVAIVTATAVFRTVADLDPMTENETRNIYIYVVQGIAAVLILCQLDSWQLWGGAAVLVGGTVAMIVAMAEVDDCRHAESEIGRTHFWGHAVVGAGVTIIAGQLRAHAKRAAAIASAKLDY